MFAIEQMYGAGVSTTAKSIRWALLYMCLYPDKQVKVHEEIDREIGNHCQSILMAIVKPAVVSKELDR